MNWRQISPARVAEWGMTSYSITMLKLHVKKPYIYGKTSVAYRGIEIHKEHF
jgi:hypothetical protein